MSFSKKNKVAVYYPEIAIPCRKWLSQAALYYDGVASIVPSGMELGTYEQLQKTAKSLGRMSEAFAVISDDLSRLIDEEQYEAPSPKP
jgi:hypothetical protein